MDIRKTYNELSTKSLMLSDFNSVVEFKKQAKASMNIEYSHLADILMIDLYINESLFDDALKIANRIIYSIDKVVFNRIYISVVERLIYLYINKKNFRSAYRYASMKRDFIDHENTEEVNRWYLELAYIFAELDQKEKSLLNLQAILSNKPSKQLRALTLSNMTKLYIDQNQIEEAKEALNECLTLVYKLDDDEGILYCNYLNAKLAILEKNYKLAKQSFQEFFKGLGKITEDKLYIFNEYITFLIDELNQYDEAYKLSVKHLLDIENSKDLRLKKIFYNNYLKIFILKNKNIREDAKGLLTALEVLEEEIDKFDEAIIIEASEDEKNIEVDTKLNKLIQSIENILKISTIGLNYNSLRDILINYTRQLERQISFDSATYVIFPVDSMNISMQSNEIRDLISTYNYRRGRLYEREISFDNLTGTVVEMVISQNHEIMIDFSDSHFKVVDVTTNELYKMRGTKSLIAYPLFKNKELFGCAIYTANTNIFLNMELATNFKIATKLLEAKILEQTLEENLKIINNINDSLTTEINGGSFFYNLETNMITLSKNLKDLLKLNYNSIHSNDYDSFVNNDDKKIREHLFSLYKNVEEYKIEYRISILNKEYLLSEAGFPHITKDGNVKFYYGVIKVLKDPLDLSLQAFKKLDEVNFYNDFNKVSEKARELNYKAYFIRFRVKDIEKFNRLEESKVFSFVYSQIQRQLSFKSYNLNDNDIMAVVEGKNLKEVKDIIAKLFTMFNDGIIHDDKVLKFSLCSSIVSFPTNTYNYSELLEFSLLSLSEDMEIQVFDRNIHQLYLKRKNISTCVTNQVSKGQVELLFQELEYKNVFDSYVIGYNINGIEPGVIIKEFIDQELMIKLEKIVFDSLLNKLPRVFPDKVYLKTSANTLEYLLDTKYFTVRNITKYRNIVIWITDLDVTQTDLLEKLAKFDFEIILEEEALEFMPLTNLLNNIKGFYFRSDFSILPKAIDIFKILNLTILADKKLNNYYNLKIIKPQFLKFDFSS